MLCEVFGCCVNVVFVRELMEALVEFDGSVNVVSVYLVERVGVGMLEKLVFCVLSLCVGLLEKLVFCVLL